MTILRENILRKLREMDEQKLKDQMSTGMKIIEFIKANPEPADDQFHKLASELNMEPDELEEHAYRMLGTFWAHGRAKEKGTTSFDPEQLKMGIEVEKEHTICPMMAERIAKDHLCEIKDYYSRLKKMEEDAGIKG